MKYRACVLDLDGTLLNSMKVVSERNKQVLLKMSDAGIKLIIATSRPPRTVSRILPPEILKACSFIFYNGALIHSPEHDYSFHHPIESELSNELIHCFLLNDPHVNLSIEVKDKWYSLQEYDESIMGHVLVKPEVRTLEQLGSYSPTKIIVSGNNLLKIISQRYGENVRILETDRGKLIQISSLDASKELGLVKLSDLYGFSLKEMICFGDDINDLGLFEICGHSVAMANGIEELKNIATEITLSNDDDGVAVVLERLY